MKIKTKLTRAYFAIVLAVTPLFGMVQTVSAEPGNFSVGFDAPSVAPGQADVPVYVYVDSNGTDVSFAGCELIVNPAQATFSHGSDDNGSFTSDFDGPNGQFDGGGGADQRLFYANASPAVSAASNIEVYVMYYDISASASGSISVGFDTADTGNCLISDETSTSFVTINGTASSLDVSGVTITESASSTDVIEGGLTDTYDVVLDAEPASDVIVDVTVDAQVNADVSSLTFTNADWDIPQTVTVSGENDNAVEGSHSGTVTMAVNSSSDALYVGLTVPSVSVNVGDDDGLLVEFSDATADDNEGDSGSTSPAFNLTISGADTTGGSAETVDVDVTGGTATGGGDDYTFTDPTTITVPAADYTTSQTIAIPGLSIEGDTTVELSETITFALISPTSGIAIGDADGADGSESVSTFTITDDDTPVVDSDDDGITNAIEDAGPNGGDANGDGTPDSAQPSVAAIVNGLTNEYVVLELEPTSGCSIIDSFAIETENSQSVQDGNYDYPYGLNDFTLSCASAGGSSTVTILLDREYDTADWTVRKLNRNANTYADLSAASFGTRGVGSKTVTAITYSITDGSALDEDGAANATIIDPVGIGTVAGDADDLSETGSGSDGLSETGMSVHGILIAGAGIVAIGLVLRRASDRYVYYRVRK